MKPKRGYIRCDQLVRSQPGLRRMAECCDYQLVSVSTTALKIPDLWGLVSGFLFPGYGLAA